MRQHVLSRILMLIPFALLAACGSSSDDPPAPPASAPITGTNFVASIQIGRAHV